MRIDRDGVWHHEGRPISRKPLVKLFSSVLSRDDAGDYWLITPVERGRIEVEDAPFVVVELGAEGTGRNQVIRVRTNLDEWVTIGPDHPLLLRLPGNGPASTPPTTKPTPPQNTGNDETPLPYVDVRKGLEGRLVRSVYYELVDLGDEHKIEGISRYGVWSAGQFFPLD
jgi:hypothetical protein